MVLPNYFEGNRFVIPPFGLGTPPEFTPAPAPVPAPTPAPAVVLTPEQRRYIEQQIADADAGSFGFGSPESTMATAGPSLSMATEPASDMASTATQDFEASPGFSAPTSTGAFSRDSVMAAEPQGFSIGPAEVGAAVGRGVGMMGGPGALAGTAVTGALGGQVTQGDIAASLGKTAGMAFGGPIGMGIGALAGGVGALMDIEEANKGIETFNKDMEGFIAPQGQGIFMGVDPVNPISAAGKTEAFTRGALSPITAPLSMFGIEPFAGPREQAREAYQAQQAQFEAKGFDKMGFELDPTFETTPEEEGPIGLASEIGLANAMDVLGPEAFAAADPIDLAEAIGVQDVDLGSYGVTADPTGFDFDFDIEAEAVEDEPGQEGFSDPSDVGGFGAESGGVVGGMGQDTIAAEAAEFDIDLDPDFDIEAEPDIEAEEAEAADEEGEEAGEDAGEGEDGEDGGEDGEGDDDGAGEEHDGGRIVKKAQDKKRRDGLKGDEVKRILQTGEFVIKRKSAEKLGKAALEKINAGNFDTLKLYNALGIKPNGRNRSKRGFQRKRA